MNQSPRMNRSPRKTYKLPARFFVNGQEVVPCAEFEFDISPPKPQDSLTGAPKCHNVSAIFET